MMRFSVGDKVVHPIHGPGLVAGVQHQELVEGFEHYYVLEMADSELTVFVPMRKVDELGVRPAVSRSELGRILDTLKARPQKLPQEYRERRGQIQEKLTSGSLVQIGEAVRDLTWRERRDHLTRTDSRLLDQGRQLLASEMALVTDSAVDDAKEAIDATLAGGVAKEDSHEDHRQMSTASDQATDTGGEQWSLMDSLRQQITEVLRLRAN